MQTIINYFNNAPDWHRILLFCFITFCVWNIENVIPLNKSYNKWKHARFNILFLIIVSPIQYLMGFFVNGTLRYTEYHHVGLLQFNIFENHPLIIFLVGFVLMDLGEYIYHFIMHQAKGLWLVHAVHHIEEEVDVSATLREHPAETAIRLAFTILWILLTGIPIWALLFRQFIQIISNLFSHSNFKFPKKVNNLLTLLLITPNLHHIHHHAEQPYTDRNYGDVLSVWDRLFGTFYNGDLKIIYGVDTFLENSRRRNFLYLFKMPFLKSSFKIDKIKSSLLLVGFASILNLNCQAQTKREDIVLGRWMSAEKDLEIEVYKTGNDFFGKVIWFACDPPIPSMEEYLDDNNPNKSLRARHWLGMTTLTNLKYVSENRWEKGKVYEPNSGHTYSASATLNDVNTVSVRGFWGIELFGRTLIFNRVK